MSRMLALAFVALLAGPAVVNAAEAQCATGACEPQMQNVEVNADGLEEDLDVTLLQTRVVKADGEIAKDTKKGDPDDEPFERDIFRIICPFLSTLVNEGVLENKDGFTMQELQDITAQAGLPEKKGDLHIIGNFENNPSGVQDIFAMEGAANEHFTSVGISDCPTLYFNCKDTGKVNPLIPPPEDGTPPPTIAVCENITLDCELPNTAAFEQFWSEVDFNKDGFMTKRELEAATADDKFLNIVDHNPIGGGTIGGAHQFIIDIFGTPKKKRISKQDLFDISINRKFPAGFVFPSA